MKNVIIIGKEGKIENYKLLIDNTHLMSISYDESKKDYKDFLDKVSTDFTKAIFMNSILSESSTYRLDLLNGFKINKQRLVKIERLENNLFESMLVNKVNKFYEGKGLVLPGEITN